MSRILKRGRQASSLGIALVLSVSCGCSDVSNRRRTISHADGVRPKDAAVSNTQDASALSNVGSACSSSSSCRAPSTQSEPICMLSVDPAASVQANLAAIWELLAGTIPDGGVKLDLDGGERLVRQDLSVELPGGYCSAMCRTEQDCGRGGACVGPTALVSGFGLADAGVASFIDELGVCLEPCDRDADCREGEGYVCRGAAEGLLPDAWLRIAAGSTELHPPYHCLPPR